MASHGASAGPSQQLGLTSIGERAPKKFRSSDGQDSGGPASMRHLLNPEASASSPSPGGNLPEGATADALKMIIPQHTEQSYAREVQMSHTNQETAPYQIFAKDQVPWRSLEILGRGNLAIVDKVERINEKAIPAQVYARKVYTVTPSQNKREILQALEASKCHRQMHLVSIIMTYEEFDGPLQSYGIVMEPIAQSNLEDYLEDIHESGKYQEPETQELLRKWFGCLASALAHLHAKGISHGDVQPSNILIKDTNVYFTYFDVAKHFRSNASTRSDVCALGLVYLNILTTLAGKYRKGFTQWRNQQKSSEIQLHLGKLLVWLENDQDKEMHEFNQCMVNLCSQMVGENPDVSLSSFAVATCFVKAAQLYEPRKPPRAPTCNCTEPWFSSGHAMISFPLSVG
jgi:serine/threonine protein kinase